MKTRYMVAKISSERLTVELQFNYLEEQLILFFLIASVDYHSGYPYANGSSNNSLIFCFLFFPAHQSVWGTLFLQLGLCENKNLYFNSSAVLSVMSADCKSGKVCREGSAMIQAERNGQGVRHTSRSGGDKCSRPKEGLVHFYI